MTQDERFFIKHLTDLAEQSFKKSIYTFSGFLNLAEQDLMQRNKKEFHGIPFETNGGYPGCERVMVRFGSEENCYGEDTFPIARIRVVPKNAKFSGELGHRDFLGALMNLGLERDRIGDIIVSGKEAEVFCVKEIAGFIIEKLDRIAHTTVVCADVSEEPRETQAERSFIELVKPVSSERLDAIVAAVAGCSRSVAAELIQAGKVYVNQRLCESNSAQLKPEDVLTIRGYGKYRSVGVNYTGRKGKLHIKVEKYA